MRAAGVLLSLLAAACSAPGVATTHGCPPLPKDTHRTVQVIDVDNGKVVSARDEPYFATPLPVQPSPLISPAVLTTPFALRDRRLVVQPAGRPAWYARPVTSRPVAEAGGTLAYLSRPFELRGADALTGAPRWNLSRLGLSFGSLVAVDGDDLVLLGNAVGQARGGLLVRFDARLDRVEWKVPVAGATVFTARGRVVAVGTAAEARDLGTGKVLWRVELPLPTLLSVAPRGRTVTITSATTVYGCD